MATGEHGNLCFGQNLVVSTECILRNYGKVKYMNTADNFLIEEPRHSAPEIERWERRDLVRFSAFSADDAALKEVAVALLPGSAEIEVALLSRHAPRGRGRVRVLNLVLWVTLEEGRGLLRATQSLVRAVGAGVNDFAVHRVFIGENRKLGSNDGRGVGLVVLNRCGRSDVVVRGDAQLVPNGLLVTLGRSERTIHHEGDWSGDALRLGRKTKRVDLTRLVGTHDLLGVLLRQLEAVVATGMVGGVGGAAWEEPDALLGARGLACRLDRFAQRLDGCADGQSS